MEHTKKKIFKTADGSPTLYLPQFDEYYHSKHGALQEAQHVYLEMGFNFWEMHNANKNSCCVFELGFGTGLNAFLTAKAAEEKQRKIRYTTIDAFPLSASEIKAIDYASFLAAKDGQLYQDLHALAWEKEALLSDFFSLEKIKVKLENFILHHQIDLIYYDAFGARTQPEMWEDDCFPPLVNSLNPGGVLVTYSAKGSVQRALKTLGLDVELVTGPPGKREMIRAFKPHL